MDDAHSLTTIVENRPLDLAVSAWLDEHGKRWDEEQGTWKHTRTSKAYEETLTAFRASLQRGGLDLNSKPGDVALVAQVFARYSARGKPVEPTTQNVRLSILSSFYLYCKRKGPESALYIEYNPIEQVKREKVDEYESAEPLEGDEVNEYLRAIDQSTLKGTRDYAILSILFQTARRAQEVATLQWQHVSFHHDKIRLTFEHTKGKKKMQDDLPVSATNALLRWLRRYYGDLEKLAPDTPLWVSLARDSSYGKPLGYQSMNALCKKHLNISRVHVTRHTTAYNLEKLGLTVSEIQERLGHKSIATTGRYLAKLKRAENRKADELAALYGIE